MISVSKPIDLINTSKDQIIVSFPEGLKGKALFSPKYSHIEKHMSTFGLVVPKALRKGSLQFPRDRIKIRLGDEGFGPAFYELYYRNTMDSSVFKWRERKVQQ